jgi:hypothetical protein
VDRRPWFGDRLPGIYGNSDPFGANMVYLQTWNGGCISLPVNQMGGMYNQSHAYKDTTGKSLIGYRRWRSC